MEHELDVTITGLTKDQMRVVFADLVSRVEEMGGQIAGGSVITPGENTHGEETGAAEER